MTTIDVKVIDEALDRMDKAIVLVNEAGEFYQAGRDVIDAVGAMVAVVPQVAGCRCPGEHKGLCVTCRVWQTYAVFEEIILKTGKPLDSPPAG